MPPAFTRRRGGQGPLRVGRINGDDPKDTVGASVAIAGPTLGLDTA